MWVEVVARLEVRADEEDHVGVLGGPEDELVDHVHSVFVDRPDP